MKELEQIFKHIKNREFLPIYFFHGEEAFFIDAAVKALENDVLTEDEKAFNQAVVYGKDTNYNDILALSRQYPMMGDKRNGAAGVRLLQDPDDIDRRSETMAIRAKMDLSQDIRGIPTLFLASVLGGWEIVPRLHHKCSDSGNGRCRRERWSGSGCPR